MRDGALEQAWSELQLGTLRGDDDGAEVVVRDRRETAAAKDAPHLGQCANRFADVHQDGVGVHDVEARLVEGQLVDGGRGELGVADRALGGGSPRRLDLAGVGVDPDDAAGGDCRSEIEGDAAHAAPDVEHVHAGTHVRQEERQEPARVAVGDVPVLHALLDHVPLVDGINPSARGLLGC